MEHPFVITGPIRAGKRGWPFGAHFGDLGLKGYIEEEYFIEGTACHFSPAEDLGSDGRWRLEKADSLPYKTRFLVRRPADAAKFNGTVVVEWINVSGGYEVALADPEGIYDNGFAYVCASVQPTGIEGFASRREGLTWWDPERYGSLHIPDDGVPYDIFTQIARAVGPERDSAVDPMGGLPVKRLIGTGASQSGIRIMAYLNGVQPLENAFHGFIPIVCSGYAADFEAALGHGDPGAGSTSHSRSIATLVRTDSRVPVLELNSQTEAQNYCKMRQPDSAIFRSWEVAGATHLSRPALEAIRMKTIRDGVSPFMNLTALEPLNTVDWAPVLEAAIVQMARWLTGAGTPPQAPPIEMDGDRYACDAHGNVKGGIRLPALEVPAAKYIAGPDYPLGGYTQPFMPDLCKTLYPSREDYIAGVERAAQAACEAGFVLPYRVQSYVEAARCAGIPVPFVPEAKRLIRKITPGKATAKKSL